MSDIQKKLEALTAIPLIHVYTNKINNRLSFKIKDGDISHGYKCLKQLNHLAAQKIIDNTKNGENVPSLEVVEVVLVIISVNKSLKYYTLLLQIQLMLIC